MNEDQENAEYQAFVDKFKPKKTTDDCYTPKNIYRAVLMWASHKYGFPIRSAVRPFWPGGDYRSARYPKGCVVLDNPPFSILSEIVRFYNERNIPFFLFGPALTIFTCRNAANYIICGASITYANGAVVNTSFVTNMGDHLMETAPDLSDILKREDERNRRKNIRELPKYTYPPSVVTAAAINYISVHGIDFKIDREDAVFIRKLDEQDAQGKTLFGGGFLLSERAAAERAAATVWNLSPRELELQKSLERRDVK